MKFRISPLKSNGFVCARVDIEASPGGLFADRAIGIPVIVPYTGGFNTEMLFRYIHEA
jgi:hypothetical protein